MTAQRPPKPGWRNVTLGGVATNSTKATKDPEGDRFERYIVGKDIPSGGGPITTWSPVGDGLFGSRIRTIVEDGDVICTTRGPNLRVARSTFRCLGAHTNFVLRTATEQELLQGYLALVVESDDFQQHLRRNFRGSVNLFVNWSDAAKYEFALPPLDEQKRIVELLSAASADIDRTEELLEVTDSAAAALTAAWLTDSGTPEALSELADVTVGIVVKPAALYVDEGVPDAVPALRSLNVLSNRLNWDDLVYISEEAHEAHAKSRLSAGDVVVVRSGRPGDAAVVPPGVEDLNCVDLLIVRCGVRVIPAYLCRYLNSPQGSAALLGRSAGTAQKHLNAGQLKQVAIPLLPIEAQMQMILALTEFDGARSRVIAKLAASRELMGKVREEVLAGNPA